MPQQKTTKTVEIDFMFIDLEVCTRCKGTDANLEAALEKVRNVLDSAGVHVTLRKTLVDTESKAQELGFTSSPTIRVNGRDVAFELRESNCESCGEACGCDGEINCRVWIYEGQEYTAAPAPMIVDPILSAVYSSTEADSAANTNAASREPQALLRLESSEGWCVLLRPGKAGHLLRAESKVELLPSVGARRSTCRLRMPMTRKDASLDTEDLWREFHERLRAFVSRRAAAAGDVEDIMQDVFLRLHRNIDSVHDRERLPAWIFQITRNAIIDRYRANCQQSVSTESDLDSLPAPSHGEEEHDERKALSELAGCIEPMVAALPEIYREAIQSTELNGLTQLEAARRSGLSASGMKSRVQRARRELKTFLLHVANSFNC